MLWLLDLEAWLRVLLDVIEVGRLWRGVNARVKDLCRVVFFEVVVLDLDGRLSAHVEFVEDFCVIYVDCGVVFFFFDD